MPVEVASEDAVHGKQLKEVDYLVFYEINTKKRETITETESVYAPIMAVVVIAFNEVKHRMVHHVLTMEDPT